MTAVLVTDPRLRIVRAHHDLLAGKAKLELDQSRLLLGQFQPELRQACSTTAPSTSACARSAAATDATSASWRSSCSCRPGAHDVAGLRDRRAPRRRAGARRVDCHARRSRCGVGTISAPQDAAGDAALRTRDWREAAVASSSVRDLLSCTAGTVRAAIARPGWSDASRA